MDCALQFDQMREREVKPNVYIYNALIKAQASTGDLAQVMLLILGLQNTTVLISGLPRYDLLQERVSFQLVG